MKRTTLFTVVLAAGLLAPAASATAAAERSAAKPPPHAEHVPASLHKAKLTYQKGPGDKVSKRRTVHGHKAHQLVHAYDHLKREPKSRPVCDIAGGPTETVIFRTAAHTWKASQSPCSEVLVVRDGKTLPTLIASRKWDNDIKHDLGF